MSMKLKSMTIIAGLFIAGSLQASVIYSANGFESHSTGAIVGADPGGTGIWLERDNNINNNNPDWASVQTSVVNNGSQALGISDQGIRITTRLHTIVATNTLMYFEASYKSEAANDFGFADIQLRYSGGAVHIRYDELDGAARWFQATDNSLRSGAVTFGDWQDVRIETDFDTDTYRVLLSGVEAFTGSIPAAVTAITSWEVDGHFTDPARSPQGPYAFYVDDLEIGTIPEPATIGMIALASAGLLVWRRWMAI